MSVRRKRPSRSRREVFTVVYFGNSNRLILSEQIAADGLEDADFRARHSMPPGAVRYRVVDPAEEIRIGAANIADALWRVSRGAAGGRDE